MESDCNETRNRRTGQGKFVGVRARSHAVLALLASALLFAAIPAWAVQPENPDLSLPEAPQPKNSTHAAAPATAPCPAGNVAKPVPLATGHAPAGANSQPAPQPAPCPPKKEINWYMRFTNGPQVKPMTPSEKRWLAARNVVDPFNAVTILGSSAIAVGANAHSAYGPGMTGFGRYVGVSYSQDATLEFFSTFLIPSLVHQDPHYHRMPGASIPRRIRHAMVQELWTLGDNGKPMVNYADIVGFAIVDEMGNFYVPGQKTNLPASAERYAIGLASAPTENFVNEFLPDIARRLHVRVVLFQWIINQVGKTSAP
ncbi:MAG: hypothetical protein ABR990_09530 [Terracidiphilus sp.]